jgi:electron transfer flavoprotein alpha subunit
MGKVLLWVEHDGGAIKDATLSAVTAAGQLGDVVALVAGEGVDGVAQAAAQIAGVSAVLKADDAAYAHALAENVAPLVAGLMADHDAFVAPATTTGKNVAPRVAALLDVAQVSDILSVEGPKTFTRPIYAGNAIATVESSDAKLVVTVRATAFAKADASGGSASVEAVSGAGDAGLSSFVGAEIAKSERPELTSAKVIVSGGRALKDAETFAATITPWPTSWAPRSARAARRWTRAMCPTITRWARPARSWRRRSISPWGFPARSSTLRA